MRFFFYKVIDLEMKNKMTVVHALLTFPIYIGWGIIVSSSRIERTSLSVADLRTM